MAEIFAEQRPGHPELRVGFDMRIVGAVDLRDQRLEAGLIDHEMQMRRPVGMAAGDPEQVADRTIGRNRLAGRLDAAELKTAVVVGDEAAAQVHLGLAGILVFVKAIRR